MLVPPCGEIINIEPQGTQKLNDGTTEKKY